MNPDTPDRSRPRAHEAGLAEKPMLSFTRAVDLFRSGRDTPRAFLERCLDAIATREPTVRAFVHIDETSARQAADASTERYKAGHPLSPVDGCPVVIKDIIETVDMPTQMNSALFEGWRSGRDAAAVFALRTGGAAILGKTVTTEFAMGAPGPTRNPHDPSRTPGGSSSGSAAAVGAGMVPAGLGTQTAGSVLRPASFCGAYGFMPTHGALNMGGVHPLSNSHDVLGTIAGGLDDAWLIARHIASVVGGTPPHLGLKGPETLPAARMPQRLVRLRTDGWDELDAATIEGFERLMARLTDAGVTVLDERTDAGVARLEALLQGVHEVARTISTAERRWPYLDYLRRCPEKLSEPTRQRIEASLKIAEESFVDALAKQEAIRKQVDALSSVADGFVTLTASGPAPEGLGHTGSRSFQICWTLTACPAFSLPLLHVGGLPVGVQVMGFRDRDAELAGLARWIDELPA